MYNVPSTEAKAETVSVKLWLISKTCQPEGMKGDVLVHASRPSGCTGWTLSLQGGTGKKIPDPGVAS